MNPAHISVKPDSVSCLTGSQPDLSKFDASLNEHHVTLRKRKLPDSDSELKQVIFDFRSEMFNLLKDMRKSQSDELQNMRSDVSDIKNQLFSLRDANEKLICEQVQIKKDLSSLTESLDFHSKEQSELKTNIKAINMKIKTIDSLEQELIKVKCQLNNIHLEHNIWDQRERLNNLEITGIPEKNNESVTQYLASIANILEVQIPKDEIVHIHRVPTRISGRPKNIIVKFKSLVTKDSLISAIRKRKSLKTSDIGIPGESKPIYVNEHLTPFYKDLHKKTKEAKRVAGYKYIWIRNCKIYVRKDDTSPAFIINRFDDISKIK